MDLARIIHQVTAPLRRRVAMMVSRVVVDAVNDATQLQSLRVLGLADEILNPAEHFQQGGVSHVALKGAEGVVVCAGGYRDHPLVVGVSNRSLRPTGLAPGETVLYCTSPGGSGVKIKLLASGEIEITPTSTVTIVGDLVVTGEVTAGAALPATTVTLTGHMHLDAMGGTQSPIPGT